MTAAVFTPSASSICIISQLLVLLAPHLSKCEVNPSDKFSEFDWNLSKAVGGGVNDNVVLSPISIKLVLAMLYEGSAGNTSIQLENALNLVRNTRAYTTNKFSEILSSLEAPSKEYELDIGTKLFIDHNTQINTKYEETLARVYNASVHKVDFSKPGKAVKVINKWAASVTRGHIQDLISEADAKDSIILLLLNAIYFNGQWLQPFPINQTKSALFNVSPKQKVPANFMNSVQTQRYTESEKLDATILRLPYMGDKFAMYIILPNEVDGLKTLVESISPDLLRQVMQTMEDIEVNISLPKFHFDYVSSLRPALEQLGLRDMFNQNANLSGISPNNKENLMVSNVIQKAGLLVNEQGSTAYVATQVDLVSKFGESSVDFSADRPFIFFIEDETTDTVVFVGKVVNPGSAGTPVVDKLLPDMVQNMKPMIVQPTQGSYPTEGNYQPNAMGQSGGQQGGVNQGNQFGAFQPSGPEKEVLPNVNEQSSGQQGVVNQGNQYEGFQPSATGQAGVPPGNMVQGGTQQNGMENPTFTQFRPEQGPPTQTRYPESFSSGSGSLEGGGYYNNDGQYIKQNFDQERFTFFDSQLIQMLCVSDRQSNLVVSPASIKTVLGMVYEGAAEATELDLSRLLRLPLNKTRGLRMLHSIQRELHTPASKNIQWISANRLLVSNKLPILPEYRLAMSTMYHARVDQAKFDSASQTAQEINQWIYNVTQGFIPSLVSPESIDRDAQLVLLNAVYFKSDWLYPFNKKFTQQQCFYPEPGKCKQVNMMNQRAYINYGFLKPLLAHVVELPYADTRFSMVVVLPENEGGLPDVVRNLLHTPLLPFLNGLTPVEVQISLPSFSVQFSKDLTSTIAAMGEGILFSDNADLRYMLGQRKGKISKIIHKAKIVVNEKGTEAGAGTAGVIVPLMTSQLVQIAVTQPFLFYIRDQRSGFIFSGQIYDPSLK